MLLMLVCCSENEDGRLADDILAVSGVPNQGGAVVGGREGKELWEKELAAESSYYIILAAY